MPFGVFVHRADSVYDDTPDERYQFPKSYLSRASQFVGDWIVYYEPTKVRNSKGYFAIAKVERIIPDPKDDQMYIALIEPGSYLPLPNPVPFADEHGVIETGVLNERGKISGRAQSAVRPISPNDFDAILQRGLDEAAPSLPRFDLAPDDNRKEVDEGEQASYAVEFDREQVLATGKRWVRDRIFRRVILQAYDKRCAVTGLKLINGGGRAEVEAAHIRPVDKRGPDSVNNGLALSGTVHWMFDRGLIAIEDDLSIVVSRHVNDRHSVDSLINKTGKLVGPLASRDRPHPNFLQWHRANVFKH